MRITPKELKDRKIVQWTLAYLAAAWATLEAFGFVSERFGWPEAILQAATLVVAFGFFGALVLAWYHGEKGRQRASGPELLMLALLLVITGTVLSLLRGRAETAGGPDGPTSAPESGGVGGAAAALNALPGLAVLPFANRSDRTEDLYFTDGIRDELLTRLQRVGGLRVISATSSELYRDSDKPIPEIGRELGVGYVLEGGVQRVGDRVRINVQLIDAVDEGHLWAETYDRTLTAERLFEIQSEIVRTVAGELQIALQEGEYLRAARRSTRDLVAFELYAQGLQLGDTEEAVAKFESAVARDPSFLAAWAALSLAHSELFRTYGQRTRERWTVAREAAERAIELDPQSEDAQLAMGVYLYEVEKDYGASLEWLGRAAGNLRGDYVFHMVRGAAQQRMGRWHASLASYDAALALSPRSVDAWLELGWANWRLRRYADAQRALDQALELDPDVYTQLAADIAWARDGSLQGWRDHFERYPHLLHTGYNGWWLAMTELRYEDALALLGSIPTLVAYEDFWYPRSLLRGMNLRALGRDPTAAFEEAAAILEARRVEADWDERVHAALGLAYAGLDRRDDAVREARRAVEILPLERDALSGPWYYLNLAAVHAQFGEVDEAVEWLEKVLSIPSRYPPLKTRDHYLLIPLRGDPRFQALIDRHRDEMF